MFTLLSRAWPLVVLLMCGGCQVSVPGQAPQSVEQVAGANIPAPSAVHRLLQEGRLPEAERLLRRAIERDPDAIADRTNLGILLARTGQPDAATHELNVVLSEQPDYCPALMQQARLALDRFDIEAAEQSYRTCLKGSPAYPPALRNLGILLEIYRGEFDQALQHYELYQQAAAEPDRQVANWITDLTRRIVAGVEAKGSHQFAEVTQ